MVYLLVVPTLSPVTTEKVGDNSHYCYFKLFLFLLGTTENVQQSCFIASFFRFYRLVFVFLCILGTNVGGNSHDCYFQRFLLLLVTRLETTVTTVTSNRFHHLLVTRLETTFMMLLPTLFCCYWTDKRWRQQSWLLLPTLLLLLLVSRLETTVMTVTWNVFSFYNR